MCEYTFWKDSVPGLNEELELLADNYQDALIAVKKHIERQKLKELKAINKEVVKVNVECVDCGQIYEGWEHIDCIGHKEMTRDELVQDALNHDNKYRKFKRLHSHHTLQEGGWLKADGSRRLAS